MLTRANAPFNAGHDTAPLIAAIAAGDTHSAARALVATGLSVIPVRADGSKAPRLDGWRAFTDRRPTVGELRDWFRAPDAAGIGVPGGPASGNLVVLDFEAWAAFARWGGLLSESERTHLARCPVVGTPGGGAHVYARLTEPVRGARYARTAGGACLIETRGAGHFVVAPGSPAACHRTGRPYALLRAGWLDGQTADPLPLDVFHALTVHAAALNEYARPAAREVVGREPAGGAGGDRPGDRFNAWVAWADILVPHGWTAFRATNSATYWTRPGKAAGVSASTGFCRGESGRDLLYVFSTAAAPFEAEASYSRFAAYALLNHRGDYAAATRTLALAGYGDMRPRGRKWVRA